MHVITLPHHQLSPNEILSTHSGLLQSIPDHIKQIVSANDTVRASVPLILKGQRSGEIKSGDPLALSLAFWGALQGIAELRLWFPEAPVPDARCIVDILKRGQE